MESVAGIVQPIFKLFDWLLTTNPVVLQNWLIFFAALVALIAIRAQSNIAKKRNTIEAVMLRERDDMHEDAFRLIKECHRNGNAERLANLARPLDCIDDDEDRENAICVQEILNYYEYFAIGINENIFSERTLKLVQCSTVINLYDGALPYINRLRSAATVRNTAYQELEYLAKRWQKSRLKSISKGDRFMRSIKRLIRLRT